MILKKEEYHEEIKVFKTEHKLNKVFKANKIKKIQKDIKRLQETHNSELEKMEKKHENLKIKLQEQLVKETDNIDLKLREINAQKKVLQKDFVKRDQMVEVKGIKEYLKMDLGKERSNFTFVIIYEKFGFNLLL